MVKYAGVGWRGTPPRYLKAMQTIAYTFHKRGHILRSGGAIGPDTAFESEAGDLKEIFKAKSVTMGYTLDDWAFELAQSVCPYWDRLPHGHKLLHARNAKILLGSNGDDPVKFVVCYTDKGAIQGGTGQTIRMAQSKNIPVFNIFNDDEIMACLQFGK